MKKNKYIFASILILIVGLICGSILNEDSKTITTSTSALSNKCIGWGLKRMENHAQPDLVQRMIDEGHIVGNQSPHALMDIRKNQLNSSFAKKGDFKK